MTELIDATLEMDVGKVQELINSGVDVNEKDEYDKTALMYIVRFRGEDKSCMQTLMDKNDHTTNFDDKIDMIVGKNYSWFTVHKELDEDGFELDEKDKWTMRYQLLPLDLATIMYMTASKKISDILIESGADINARCAKMGETTALLLAVNGESVATVKKLIDSGAEINQQTKNGVTALLSAVFAEKLKMVKCLLENGADALVKDKNGNTALLLAQQKNNTAIIELLKEYGA